MFGKRTDEIEMDVSEMSFTPDTPLEEARASTEALIATLGAKIDALAKTVAEEQALLADYKRVLESYKLALANMNQVPEPKKVKTP